MQLNSLSANDVETPAPCEFRLGTGERHRGYAQHRWLDQRGQSPGLSHLTWTVRDGLRCGLGRVLRMGVLPEESHGAVYCLPCRSCSWGSSAWPLQWIGSKHRQEFKC